jgi:hypothetical protein
MSARRSTIPVLLVGVLVAPCVRADLTPLVPSDVLACRAAPSAVRESATRYEPAPASDENPVSREAWNVGGAPSRHASHAVLCEVSDLLDFSILRGCFGTPPGGSLPVQGGERRQGLDVPSASVRVLSDRQNSFILCLYGFLGVGAFRSLTCLRRPALGMIPEWYHNGGPAQIGHSLALAPDCRVSLPACCLVQPDQPTRNPGPRYGPGMRESFQPKSPTLSARAAPRGPPPVP